MGVETAWAATPTATPEPSGGMSGAAGKGSVPIQQVWVHCIDEKEKQSVNAYCKRNRRLHLLPQPTDVSDIQAWDEFLRLHLPATPIAYRELSLEAFIKDVATWLAASAKHRIGEAPLSQNISTNNSKNNKAATAPASTATGTAAAMAKRWPGLLVTDRWQLVAAAGDLALQQTLSHATRFLTTDLLPVVFSSDFGILSGAVVESAEVDVYRSPSCWETPSSTLGSGFPSSWYEEIPLGLGVFIQHHTGEDARGRSALFGSRCLTLLPDGRGAYAALSPDGRRTVEVAGRWEVINGHIVIAKEDTASVRHRVLSGRMSSQVEGIAYEEPVHVSLRELQADFESAVDVASCIPRGGERLRLLLREAQDQEDEEEEEAAGLLAAGDEGGDGALDDHEGAVAAAVAAADAQMDGRSSNPEQQASTPSNRKSPGQKQLLPRPSSAVRSARPSSKQRPGPRSSRQSANLQLPDARNQHGLDHTYASAWDITFDSSLSPEQQRQQQHLLMQQQQQAGASGVTFTTTSLHALKSLSENSRPRTSSATSGGLGAEQQQRQLQQLQQQQRQQQQQQQKQASIAKEAMGPGPSNRAPRLLGLNRGLTFRGMTDQLGRRSEEEEAEAERKEAEQTNSGISPFRWLSALGRDPSLQQTDNSPKGFRACPLGLGRYRHQSGVAGRPGFSLLELVLHVDGTCEYKEEQHTSSAKALPDAATFKILGGGTLLLQTRRSGKPGFRLQERRGNRTVQRAVQQVELSIRVLLQKCSFEPFQQQEEPFPGHTPLPAEQLIFGRVDPLSPVFLGLKCKPDRLPYHAFEDSMRKQGLPVDEILSDFAYLDRDSDGQVSAQELATLLQYGSIRAPPELLHELREALVQEFGTPYEAFEAMQKHTAPAAAAPPGKGNKAKDKDKAPEASPTGGVSRATFESFLRQLGQVEGTAAAAAAAEEEKDLGSSVNSRSQPKLRLIQEWLLKVNDEDFEAVFASLNPQEKTEISSEDFMSINLNTAVLAVRRLDHFQSWIREQFGVSQDVYRTVYKALDTGKAGVLTRSAFVNAAQALGYPLDAKCISSMFSLLDRNFDGEVTARDFQKLRGFDGSQVLKELVALKRLVDDQLDGVDACFRKFQERERSIHHQSVLPKRVSFDSFQKALNAAGFNKLHPSADLKVLFLFITEASGKHANGFLTQGEWALLRGLDASAVKGSPARLRRLLEQKYGSMDEAFQRMHTSWMKRTLVKGLKQTALAAMARALCLGDSSGSARLLPGPVAGPAGTALRAAVRLRQGPGHAGQSSASASASASPTPTPPPKASVM